MTDDTNETVTQSERHIRALKGYFLIGDDLSRETRDALVWLLEQHSKKEAPAGEDRGQGGSKETTTKNRSSV